MSLNDFKVDLAQKVVTHIKANPLDHNQGHFACGTSHCIAGWVVELGDPGAQFVSKHSGTQVIPSGRNLPVETDAYAARLLGTDPFNDQDELAGKLFGIFYNFNDQNALEEFEALIQTVRIAQDSLQEIFG